MEINRREFIKGLTLFGAAALTGTFTTACSNEPTVSKKYLVLNRYDDDTVLGYIYEAHQNGSRRKLYIDENDNIFGRHNINIEETDYMSLGEDVSADDIKSLELYFDGNASDEKLYKVIYKEEDEYKILYCDEFRRNNYADYSYTFLKNGLVVKDNLYGENFVVSLTDMRMFLDPYTSIEYGAIDKTQEIVKGDKQKVKIKC